MIKDFADINLADRNSFHVRQCARRLVEFDEACELHDIFAGGVPGRWMVLGGGNNILFTRDYDGLLLVPRCGGCRVTGEDPDHVYMKVGAGVEWDDLVEETVSRGLWGLENLSLIPGKVGAAPVQNIGAYGAEAGDSIVEVEMFCPDTMNMLTLSAEHCGFGYRESIFKGSLKGRVVITAVTFRLSKHPRPNVGYGDLQREVEARGGISLRNIRDAVCAIRRSKLPDTSVLGNAGSFFKNPVVDDSEADRLRSLYPSMPSYPAPDGRGVKLAAGWLIEQAGMKGVRQGAVGVHERQALVIVNHGGATGAEVLAFARRVQACVRDKFGVDIDTEVNII
ncbi:MAG: UDP-N-acetylmuramate dehydrogenase [Alistipes sp.]|nr:UDP-N-acetylmuramate dehydrogenase [Alistipes sp.]